MRGVRCVPNLCLMGNKAGGAINLDSVFGHFLSHDTTRTPHAHVVLGGLLARSLGSRPDLVNPPEAGRRAQEAGRQETGHSLSSTVRPGVAE